MPAPPADGGGTGSEVPNPGEWESWAREAETLWAAVSARKPRLEVASDSGREGRQSAPGRDAGGVPGTHAAWPAARLFTPGTTATPAGCADAAFAASAAPPASRGPTASVPGWRRDDARATVPASETDFVLFHGETDAVAAFASASKAARVSELLKRCASQPARVLAARAWRDVERAYLRAAGANGVLGGTPLALRGADAARGRVFSTLTNPRPNLKEPGARAALASLPFPRELVRGAFRAWRRRRATKRGASLIAARREKTRLARSLRFWRDDVFRRRARKAVREAVAFELWRAEIVVSRARRVAGLSHKTRATRRGATGAWRVWRALAASAAKKATAADSVARARRIAVCIAVWRERTDAARRDRAWCAFAETWRARRALAKNVSLWRQLVSEILEARDAAEATRLKKRHRTTAAVFFLWRRRAATIAAGTELVRLACQKWRFETMDAAFGAFRAAASRKRAARFASDAFRDAKLSSKALKRWREVVVAIEREVFGAASVKMRDAANALRLRGRVSAWRLAVFRGRERDGFVLEASFARRRRVCFEGWVAVAETAADVQRDLLAETERLGWPDRVRSRRAFVTWRERATHRAAYRERVEAEMVVVASRNRARRSAARWRLNAAEAILARLQWKMAELHRIAFALRAFRSEVARRVRARLATQMKLGVSAIRRLAICHAGWRAFVDEMRPLRRRLRRFRETTRAGHTVPDASFFVNRARGPPRNTHSAQRSVGGRRPAALQREAREAREAADAATVGPLVAAAARARVKKMRLEPSRAEADFEACARTRRRLGKVWSDMVARETADAFSRGGGVRKSVRADARDAAGRPPSPRERRDPPPSRERRDGVRGKPPRGDGKVFSPADRRGSAEAVVAASAPLGGGSPAKAPPPRDRLTPNAEDGGDGGDGTTLHPENGTEAAAAAFFSPTRNAASAIFVSPNPSPSRASEGFRSARSSAPSSASVSRAPSANPSPAKANDTPREGPAEEALRVLRERVAARLAAVAESPTAVSWSPARRGERASAPSPDRRQSSSETLETRARFDTE